MKAILAVNNLGVIGKDNTLPWRSIDDLKHFKQLTLHKNCLVGRKTFESLPPLKNRNLIVVGTGYFHSIEAAINSVNGKIDWVIGGKTIYEQTLHLCDELHISHINNDNEGDTFFPDIRQFKGRIINYFFDSK